MHKTGKKLTRAQRKNPYLQILFAIHYLKTTPFAACCSFKEAKKHHQKNYYRTTKKAKPQPLLFQIIHSRNCRGRIELPLRLKETNYHKTINRILTIELPNITCNFLHKVQGLRVNLRRKSSEYFIWIN